MPEEQLPEAGSRIREHFHRAGCAAASPRSPCCDSMPVAPYCVVSLLAPSVVRVPRVVPYLLGTGLGMAPGILSLRAALDRAQVVLRNPCTCRVRCDGFSAADSRRVPRLHALGATPHGAVGALAVDLEHPRRRPDSTAAVPLETDQRADAGAPRRRRREIALQEFAKSRADGSHRPRQAPKTASAVDAIVHPALDTPFRPLSAMPC